MPQSHTLSIYFVLTTNSLLNPQALLYNLVSNLSLTSHFSLLTSSFSLPFNQLVRSSSWLPERPCSWTRGHTESKWFLVVSPYSLPSTSLKHLDLLFPNPLRILSYTCHFILLFSFLLSTPHALDSSATLAYT